MKCIHCGHDSKLKERQASSGCPVCKRRFAFEPTTDPLKVTDVFFEHAIQLVSGDGKFYYTERQLWYEFCRRLAARPWWPPLLTVGVLSALGAICLASIGQTNWPFVVAGLVVVLAGLYFYWEQRNKRRHPAVTFETFDQNYLMKWARAHGGPARLLPRTEPRLAAAVGKEPDVTSYSFDRVVVTERAPLAAMLVANNFHFEHNCAILSVDGYPAGRADTILAMLRRNPALTVYALHDASAAGCQLPLTLRRPEWFPDRATAIFDLGLRPRHVTRKRWMMAEVYQPVLTDEVRRLLTAREAAWLEAGHTVELAVLRPAELLRAVYRTIARSSPARDKSEKDDDYGGDVWVYSGGGHQSDGDSDQPDADPVADDFDGGDSDGGDIGGADSFG